MKHDPWAPENWSAHPSQLHRPELPLVSLGVLNYNRKDDLRKTLDVLQHAVQYPTYEIIVVDNGSTDGSSDMVRSCFPQVKLVTLPENIGTCARNFQAQNARGKYLFSFDDDTIPGTPSMVLRIVEFMEAHPDIDVLNGQYYQPLTGILETEGWEIFRYGGTPTEGYEGIYLVEGGVCFRLSSLVSVEGYDPAIFYAAEGPDLALQLYKKQFRIVLCPWFLTLHFKSPVERSNQRAAFWSARHTVWMIAKHWPLPVIAPLLALFVGRRVLGMLLQPATAVSRAKGILAGIRGIRPFLSYGPKLTLRQMIGLKRFYLQLYRW